MTSQDALTPEESLQDYFANYRVWCGWMKEQLQAGKLEWDAETRSWKTMRRDMADVCGKKGKNWVAR